MTIPTTELLQAPETGVSVGIGLKISEIRRSVAIASPMKDNTLVYLFRDCLLGTTVGRMKGCIVTESTASRTHTAVTVRAGEACVNHDFLKPRTVALAEKVDVGAVASPWSEYSVRQYSFVFVHFVFWDIFLQI